MTDLEILEATRALLTPPQHWIKGRFQDHVNNVACFCLAGALRHCTPPDMYPNRDFLSLRNKVIDAIPPGPYPANIGMFNDHRTTQHRDVLAVLDTAIAAERARLREDT